MPILREYPPCGSSTTDELHSRPDGAMNQVSPDPTARANPAWAIAGGMSVCGRTVSSQAAGDVGVAAGEQAVRSAPRAQAARKRACLCLIACRAPLISIHLQLTS